MRLDREIVVRHKDNFKDSVQAITAVTAVGAAVASFGVAATEVGVAAVLPRGPVKKWLMESAGNNAGRGFLLAVVGLGVAFNQRPEEPEAQVPQITEAPKVNVLNERDIPRPVFKAPVEDQVVRRMMA